MVNAFIEAYDRRDYMSAVQVFLPSFERELAEAPPFDRMLAQYADALTHGDPYHAFIANRQLQAFIEGELSLLLTWEGFLKALRRDEAIFLTSIKGSASDDPFARFLLAEREEMVLSDEELGALWSQNLAAEPYARFSQHFVRFKRERGAWCGACGLTGKPYVPLRIGAPKGMLATFLEEAEKYSWPLVVVEPYNLPWKVIEERVTRGTFWFPSSFAFLQCLQHADFLELALRGHHLLLIGTAHPQDQLAAQPRGKRPDGIVFATQNPWWVPNGLALLEAVQSEDHDLCYQLGRSLHFLSEGERLGDSRFAALWSQAALKEWRDPHKGRAFSWPASLGRPLVPDRMEVLLSQCTPIAPRRSWPKKGKWKLVHILNTVMDHGHAPSEILRSLMKHHDREQFELSLFTTECGLFRPSEYPYHAFTGRDSTYWGANTVRALRGEGIDVRVLGDGSLGYRQEAIKLAEILREEQIDIAVFHIPNAVTLMAACFSEVPRRVFFDHGGAPPPNYDHSLVLPSYLGLPAYEGFDLIVGCEERVLEAEKYYQTIGTRLVSEPIVVDVRQRWSASLPAREALELPKDGLLMTTLSLHLADRLSPAFLNTVVEILKQEPDAYYLPIGGITDPARFLAPFQEVGVADRVRFLGYRENPSDLLRHMDLYLNEFPFGGGIALLEAMAAGVPIVSLWDAQGPPQGRLAGVYFNRERMTDSPASYVELGVSLLKNRALHQRWRQEVIESYEQRTDVTGYVSRLEAHFLSL